MKQRMIKNKKEVKFEEITKGKYYAVDIINREIWDLYFTRICDFKGILENDSYIIIEVEREGK